jgi:hypothetical protein
LGGRGWEEKAVTLNVVVSGSRNEETYGEYAKGIRIKKASEQKAASPFSIYDFQFTILVEIASLRSQRQSELENWSDSVAEAATAKHFGFPLARE